MKILTIEEKKDEDFLRTPTKEVDLSKEDKKDLKETIKKMRRVMHEAEGVGLSANQVGIEKKFFIAQVSDNQGKPKFYSLINPEITWSSEEEVIMEEGCLSIPGVMGPVKRPEKIVVEGLNVEGKKKKIKAWGYLARVFQHEIDHLNGVLFIDKTDRVYKIKQSQQI